ncbi:protein of unknown function [Burkholderia multivorans]
MRGSLPYTPTPAQIRAATLRSRDLCSPPRVFRHARRICPAAGRPRPRFCAPVVKNDFFPLCRVTTWRQLADGELQARKRLPIRTGMRSHRSGRRSRALYDYKEFPPCYLRFTTRRDR